MTTTGIVCALAIEADCLNKVIASGLPGGHDIRIGVSGPGAEAARQCAEALLEEGVQALLSWGVAAGLSPDLSAGSLLLPTDVYAEHSVLPVNAAWHTRVSNMLASSGLDFAVGAMAHTPGILATPLAKQTLVSTGNAVAADMESAAVAAVAFNAGLPFLVVRAVVDPLARTLPPWIASALDEDGGLRPSSVCKGLLHHPADIGVLPGLAWEFHKARQSLCAAAKVLVDGRVFLMAGEVAAG